MLLVTHNVIEAETVLDRVAVVDRGRVIACDTPAGLKAAVADEVRLDLVWRDEPPLRPAGDRRAAPGGRTGRPPLDAAAAAPTRPATVVATVTAGPAFAALDDFTLATPSLEDVYLALGGRQKGLVKA